MNGPKRASSISVRVAGHPSFGVANFVARQTGTVRIILKNGETGYYWSGSNDWVRDLEQAQTFEHTTNAIELAIQRQLPNAVVLLWFGEKQYDLELPVSAREPQPLTPSLNDSTTP